MNEVSDIRPVLSFVEETIEEREACPRLSHDRLCRLSTLLESSKATLTTLDTLVKEWLIRAYDLGGMVHRNCKH